MSKKIGKATRKEFEGCPNSREGVEIVKTKMNVVVKLIKMVDNNDSPMEIYMPTQRGDTSYSHSPSPHKKSLLPLGSSRESLYLGLCLGLLDLIHDIH